MHTFIIYLPYLNHIPTSYYVKFVKSENSRSGALPYDPNEKVCCQGRIYPLKLRLKKIKISFRKNEVMASNASVKIKDLGNMTFNNEEK